jgi:hypothetical protein
VVGLLIGKRLVEDGNEIGYDGTTDGQELRLQCLWQRLVDRTQLLYQFFC